MNDEIKEILRNCEKAINEASGYNDTTDKILDYITNLQQEIEKLNNDKRGMLVQLYKANDEKDKVKQENERLKAQLTDTEWQWQNTRCKYEKQYKKGITEELLEDIETCFFNRENPSMIPIDSLDLCHIFGYIDYLKDYKSRCEKAIEYYKMHQQECVIGRNRDDKLIKDYYLPVQHSKVLLNILQNGSEDNDTSNK